MKNLGEKIEIFIQVNIGNELQKSGIPLQVKLKIKEKDFIILTEKEIHLLEILLNSKEPISKNEILAKVWNYSSDTDTHTVETHIYRLRKKINEKFSDDNFLLNNKKGYYL